MNLILCVTLLVCGWGLSCRKFCRGGGGVQLRRFCCFCLFLLCVFLVNKGKTKNDVWLAGRRCWLGSFVIFQGLRTCIAKEPYSFVIFQGGGAMDPRMSVIVAFSGQTRSFPLSNE